MKPSYFFQNQPPLSERKMYWNVRSQPDDDGKEKESLFAYSEGIPSINEMKRLEEIRRKTHVPTNEELYQEFQKEYQRQQEIDRYVEEIRRKEREKEKELLEKQRAEAKPFRDSTISSERIFKKRSLVFDNLADNSRGESLLEKIKFNSQFALQRERMKKHRIEAQSSKIKPLVDDSRNVTIKSSTKANFSPLIQLLSKFENIERVDIVDDQTLQIRFETRAMPELLKQRGGVLYQNKRYFVLGQADEENRHYCLINKNDINADQGEFEFIYKIPTERKETFLEFVGNAVKSVSSFFKKEE